LNGSKKNLDSVAEERRQWIDPNYSEIAIARQCELLGVARSSYYYDPQEETAQNLRIMRLLDEQYTRTPFYGIRRMTAWLRKNCGEKVNHKRVARLLRLMGLETIYQKPRLSLPDAQHKIYPYLLRGVKIQRPNQVWSTDITYVRLHAGYVYLVAIMDWFSRYVISWEVSVTLESEFCISALDRALQTGRPEIFNTDQGSQFTSVDFIHPLKALGVQISMDGRGRALDNVFVERLWRTVKYEEVYLKDYLNVPVAIDSLAAFFQFYNRQRLHQSLGYTTPASVYYPRGGRK
jgi:putative transposase